MRIFLDTREIPILVKEILIARTGILMKSMVFLLLESR